jgi:prephenate dehydrogenase
MRRNQGEQRTMASNIRRVGIVGLGKMGLPMARHLRNLCGCGLRRQRRGANAG